MGTTLAAMQAGSFAFDLVIAIEGYPHLLTTGDPAAAVTAWAGTDWTTALGGLFVDLQNSQAINPWEPFQGGGTLSFHVAPDAADTFGIDTHKVAGNIKTTLTATMDRSTTTIQVASTSGFDAAGEAYVGGECFFYSSKTATTFAATAAGLPSRGRYSPFAAGGTGAPRFSTHHRVGNVDYATPLAPIVSALPRIWTGKRVGLWLHRKAAGVLDVKAQAECIFAGRIDEPSDDENTAMTVVSCTHVLDEIKDSVIGRDMWTAKIDGGIYLAENFEFTFTDTNYDTSTATYTYRTANVLKVVASGASGANQINAGYYDVPAIAAALNAWWASEHAASRTFVDYTMVLEELDTAHPSNDLRVKIDTAAGALDIQWTFGMEQIVAIFFGFDNIDPAGVAIGPWYLQKLDIAQTTVIGAASPYRTLLFEPGIGQVGQRIHLASTSGVFIDNWAQLPVGVRPPDPGGLAWGLFVIDNTTLYRGSLVGNELTNIAPAPALLSGLSTSPLGIFSVGRRYNQDDQGEIEIRQVYIFAQPFATFWNSLMFSTGTPGYNDATYDVYGFGIGIGIPAALLANFASSVAALDVAGATLQCIVDKPTKLSDLLNVDLILRRTSLVWKHGGLQMVSWSSPAAAASVYALDETNKGDPPDATTAQRSPSLLSTDWIRNVAKISYNRDTRTGDYLANVTLEDRTSIDDAGGVAMPITLPARNAFSDSANLGAGIQALLPGFLAYMPFFSNGVRKLQRSIDSRLFESIFPGDIVTVTDKFARDPQTGARGIIARPGLVVRVWYTLGGQAPDDPTKVSPMSGDVDVIFLDAIVAARSAQYSPAAELDSTASSSGFTAGYNDATKTLRFLPHEHTKSPGAHDSDHFAANDHVRIIEVDPDDPASPLTWQRQIAALAGGDDIVLTATLSSPAFDATKTYRMIPDHYTACQATQQVRAFEADATSGLIESTAAPFQYTLAATDGVLSAISHTALAEHHASLGDADGKPRDTGYDAALARTINNLVDHKTAHQSPMMDFTARANDSVSGYVLVYLRKIYLGDGTQDLVNRQLAVAPFYRSKTGASVTIRATLTRKRPVSSTYTNVTFPDLLFSSQASWSTSSTTYVTGAEALLNFKFPTMWLAVEITQHAEARGLAQCIERERT